MNQLVLISTVLGVFLGGQLHAQMQEKSDRELTVLGQLSSQPAVSGMPVARLLNASGNERLRAFFLDPVKDPTRLKGKKIVVLAADGFEEIELLGPVWYFKQLGAEVHVVSPRFNPAPERYGMTTPEMAKTHIMAVQYLNPVGWVKVDRRVDEISVDEYDAIFIPGGAWNPDNLRYDKEAIAFVKQFLSSGKLVAAICHAPIVLASADVLAGRKLTGYWNIQTDLVNAGGEVVDEPVVVDGNLITSRHPIDIADFCIAVSDWLVTHKVGP